MDALGTEDIYTIEDIYAGGKVNEIINGPACRPGLFY